MTEEHCAHLFARFRRWPVKDRWRCVRCDFVTSLYSGVDVAMGRPQHPHMSVAVIGVNTMPRAAAWWERPLIPRAERQAAKLLLALQVQAAVRPDMPWLSAPAVAADAGMKDGRQYAGLAWLEKRGLIDSEHTDGGRGTYGRYRYRSTLRSAS